MLPRNSIAKINVIWDLLSVKQFTWNSPFPGFSFFSSDMIGNRWNFTIKIKESAKREVWKGEECLSLPAHYGQHAHELRQFLVSAVHQNPARDKTEHLSSDIPRDFRQVPNPFESLLLIAWSKIIIKSSWTPPRFLQLNPTFTLLITLIRRKADTSLRWLMSTGLCSVVLIVQVPRNNQDSYE